ncbi:MAG: BREX-1 system phosphatase PglZ type A [Desulfocapsaceae bacterium]|nr:BREX-1 system phosphatase PglZ type A [Desulfocapsaceae bacterium]
MSNIHSPLARLFEKHRIVFWFDTDRELRNDFEQLDLPGVEKIDVVNNEFGIKHQILRERPCDKFLLYHEGPQPEDPLDNWLLDVQLACGEFRTDQASIYLGDLGLGPEFTDLIEAHLEFFKSTGRKEGLRDILREKDSHGVIRMKMLAICTGSDPRLDVILETLLGELAVDRQEKFKTVQRAGLDLFLWTQLEKRYGYTSETKSIRDFVIQLFKSCYAVELGQKASLGTEAVIFLKRWKDSISHRSFFEKLSNDCGELLNIREDLQARDYKALQEIDYFRIVDQKIISDLIQAITDRTMSAGECALLVRTRRQSHWYADFKDLYEAVEYASSFIYHLENLDLQIESFSAGIQKYSHSWFRIDQLYRKYIYHEKRSGQTSLLEKLTRRIEDLYINTFLLKLGDTWQQHVDACDSWKSPLVSLQNDFFNTHVSPSNIQKKVYVIISDAFRYEIGEELVRLIQGEDKFEATVEPMVSMLPSNTQVGMAALLPHKQMSFSKNGAITVEVDGVSTLGTINRGKILGAALSGKGAAIKADEFIDLNKDACRELIRSNDVVYIYHNRIDATGDKKDSEGRVFEAVEESLQDLIKIVKKLAGNNATNMIVTSDHGFIYQDRLLDESDFSSAEVRGTEIYHQDRRFVLGKGLEKHDSLKYFSTEQLGLSGQMDVQVSKSTYRMRLKGSGSRFVHGGASLQEIVVPVVKINKKRQSDVSSVSVEIIQSSSTVITSGQLSVALFQTEPVTPKKHPRIVRAGIYTKSGELISDSHEIPFDLTSEQAREREIKVRFLLTRKAEEANGQTVLLKLEEKVPGTAHYTEYRTVSYTMQRSFTTDFDF